MLEQAEASDDRGREGDRLHEPRARITVVGEHARPAREAEERPPPRERVLCVRSVASREEPGGHGRSDHERHADAHRPRPSRPSGRRPAQQQRDGAQRGRELERRELRHEERRLEDRRIEKEDEHRCARRGDERDARGDRRGAPRRHERHVRQASVASTSPYGDLASERSPRSASRRTANRWSTRAR